MTEEELEKEAEIFISEKTNKGNFDVEKFGRAYFSESSMKQALIKFAEPREKRIAELEKENAELKEKYVQNICDCDICDTYCNSQLIKAKEIIRDFLSVAVDYIDKEDKNYSFIAEAEQFLNYEVEK